MGRPERASGHAASAARHGPAPVAVLVLVLGVLVLGAVIDPGAALGATAPTTTQPAPAPLKSEKASPAGGSVRSIALTTGVVPRCLAAMPDGTLFALDDKAPFAMIEVAPSGRAAIIPLPGVVPSIPPAGCLAIGPDGNVWFADPQAQTTASPTPFPAVARFDVATHRTSYFAVPGRRANPQVLVPGDDVVWFVDATGNRIGEVDPGGKIHELPQDGLTGIAGLVQDAGGTLWVTASDASGPVVVELSASGAVIRRIPAPGQLGPPIIGPDGHVWFTSGGGLNELDAQLEPVSLVSNPDVFPASLAVDTTGRVWFTSAWFGCLGSQYGNYDPSTRKAVTYHAAGCANDLLATGTGLDGIVFSADANLIYFVDGTQGRGPNPNVSTIASAIPTIREAFTPVRSVVVNAGLAAAISMVLTFPSSLFNRTLQENYAEISGWWRRRLRRLRNLLPGHRGPSPGTAGAQEAAAGSSSARRDRAVFVEVLVVGALVNSFNDPGFGANLASLYTFCSVLLALAAGIAVAAAATWVYHTRRHGSTPHRLAALPMGLAIAVAFVVFSRAIGFEPGYLYGIVCGVLFTRKLASHEEGHVAALVTLATMLVSVLAWIAWEPWYRATQVPDAFGGFVLAADFFGALFVGGLVGSFFGMIPIKGLPGWTIKQWSPWAWAAGFLLALFGVFQILLRPGIAGHGHRPLVTSIVLFVAFGVGSVVFHEHFEAKQRHRRGEPQPSVSDRVDVIVAHMREQRDGGQDPVVVGAHQMSAHDTATPELPPGLPPRLPPEG